MSSNLVQHQRTKHIEIDLHFVRDKVVTGHVRVLNVPSSSKYADIFTKSLPFPLFLDFRSNLNVTDFSPVLSAGEDFGSATTTKMYKLMSVSNPSMEDLPEPVMVEILSRLPVKTIIHCKCVCKKWLDLVSDSYFVNLHLSRSPAGIIIHHNLVYEKMSYQVGILKWVEVEDELDHHHIHQDPLMSLDLNLTPIFQKSQILSVGGSVNGLICLWQCYPNIDNTYICNPITREYMILPLPMKQHYRFDEAIMISCLGVGSMTNKYKVIRISQYYKPPRLSEAQVYTLGTGQWRSLGLIPYWLIGFFSTFLNGHAHWIVQGMDSPEKLYAFDFDNETFKLFPSPPVETIQGSQDHFASLAVLKGCLCQSDTFESQITIWVMKEYGIKNSWHKEVIIKRSISPGLFPLTWGPMHLIEHLKDGTILMFFRRKLLGYSPQTGTVVDTENFKCLFKGLVYRPSFLKLHNFESERVHVF